jgi:hypothetical protein
MHDTQRVLARIVPKYMSLLVHTARTHIDQHTSLLVHTAHTHMAEPVAKIRKGCIMVAFNKPDGRGGVVVKHVRPDGPCDGVLFHGDRVVSFDGESSDDFSDDDLGRLTMGVAGTEVEAVCVCMHVFVCECGFGRGCGCVSILLCICVCIYVFVGACVCFMYICMCVST